MVRGRAPLRLLAATLTALVLVACGSPVPPQQNYGTIRGRVYDAASSAGLPGAVITVDETLTVTSAGDGTYRLSTVPPGPYTLRVAPPPGYAAPNLPPAAASGSVQAGETASVDVPLQKSP